MDLGLFLLHAVVGLLFMGHGAQKLFGAFGGHGLEGTAGFFESALGLRPGRLHATAAGLMEFGGGTLLLLGLLLPLAAVLITATMVAAVMTAHRGKGPWATDGGWELNVAYVLIALALAGVGGGAWSLDDVVFGTDLVGSEWLIGAFAIGLIGGVGAVISGRSGATGGADAPPSAA